MEYPERPEYSANRAAPVAPEGLAMAQYPPAVEVEVVMAAIVLLKDILVVMEGQVAKAEKVDLDKMVAPVAMAVMAAMVVLMPMAETVAMAAMAVMAAPVAMVEKAALVVMAAPEVLETDKAEMAVKAEKADMLNLHLAL